MTEHHDEPYIEKEDSSPLLGLRLRQARENKKLSVNEAAIQLRVNPGIIDALEHEKWDLLHGRTYARGYFLNYVKYLGLPQDDMLPLFNQKYIENERPVSPLQRGVPPEKPFPWLVWLVIVSVLLIVWFAYAQWQAQQSDTTQTDGAEFSGYFDELIADPFDSQIEVLSSETDAAAEQTDQVSELWADSEAAAENETPVEATENTDAETSDAGAPTGISQSNQLVLRVGDECWVEVVDATGTALYRRIARNEVLNLSGQAPFNIRLGNARAVEVTFNEQVVDLTPHVQGNVARLTVGAAS